MGQCRPVREGTGPLLAEMSGGAAEAGTGDTASRAWWHLSLAIPSCFPRLQPGQACRKSHPGQPADWGKPAT